MSAEAMARRRLLAPVRHRLWLAGGIAALGALASAVPPIMVAEMARGLMTPGAAAPPLDALALAAVAGLALRLGCNLAAGAIGHRADVALQFTLGRRIMAHLSRLPIGWFLDRSPADVRRAMRDDVGALHHLVAHGLNERVTLVVAPLAILAYLLWCDWRLALVAMLPPAFGAVLIAWQFRGYGRRMAGYEAGLRRLAEAADDHVRGIAVIKLFATDPRRSQRFQQAAADFLTRFADWVGGVAVAAALSEIVLSPLFAMVTVLWGGWALLGPQGLGVIVAFAALAPALAAPFAGVSGIAADRVRSRAAAGRIDVLLAQPGLSIANPPRQPANDAIRFENVTLRDPRGREILADVTMDLPPGRMTALVGPSGAGKTSVAELLARFRDPCAGRILWGGVDLRDIDPDWLGANLGCVLQRPHVLHASVRDNIALGCPDACDDRIRNAAIAVRLDAEIMAMPRGYDTVLGQNTVLSGGQAQRLGIARLMLSRPRVIVLDEISAHADPRTEAALLTALAALCRDRTVLAIAHRPAALRDATHVVAMSGGRILRRGGAELLAGGEGA